ncbi:MAG: nucleotidyltransferase domain-containing protein [Thermoplasmata archaeon]
MYQENARLKREVFGDLQHYLAKIKKVVSNADPNSSVYLFGSVATGKYNMASDIDILIVTSIDRDTIQKALDEENLGFPFEFHIRNKKTAEPYFSHIKEIKLI